MSENANLVVLTDEDGNEVEFEHIDTMEMDGETYLAFIPAQITAEDEAEVVVLKVAEVDGEEMLESIEDEQELMKAFDEFMTRLENMYEIDGESEGCGCGHNHGEDGCGCGGNGCCE